MKYVFQGSLIANMMLGMIILQRRYTLEKYISVALITIGIITCTIQTSSQKDLVGKFKP